MKELSIEEKAKAYDIALDKIKRLLGTGSNCSREELEYVFPELKESEDERIRLGLINAFKEFLRQNDYDKDTNFKGVNTKDAIAWLEKQGEQKPAWSEDDETTKNNISHIIREYDKISKRENQPCCYIGDCLLWMQDLKDRVQPQPKQEWSEEEIENCAREAEDNNCIILAKHIRQLKSLRPQNIWKPSDEQMEALNYVVNLMASSERPTENDLYYNILKSLRQQLKKLKG